MVHPSRCEGVDVLRRGRRADPLAVLALVGGMVAAACSSDSKTRVQQRDRLDNFQQNVQGDAVANELADITGVMGKTNVCQPATSAACSSMQVIDAREIVK